MRIGRFNVFAVFASMMLFGPQLFAQSNPASQASLSDSSPSEGTAKSADVIPAVSSTSHFLWTESFSGSTNSEGQVMLFDSTVGYVFSSRVGVDAGIPIYFVRGSNTSSAGGSTYTSNNGFGDLYGQLRLSFPNAVVNYKTVFTGTAPTGNTSTGLSTGHGTYDWTNHFDRHFGKLTPFAELGIGDSIPAAFIFNRPYQSYGHDGHFEGGTSYRLAGWLSVSALGYEIAPWGSQTIFSRVVGKSGGPVGNGGHGRVFNVSNQTTGGSSIAADNGVSLGVDVSPSPILDFSASYSYSAHFQFSTESFGVSINMSRLLRDVRAGGY